MFDVPNRSRKHILFDFSKLKTIWGMNSRNIFTGNAGNNSETTCRNFRVDNYFRFSTRKPLKQIAN